MLTEQRKVDLAPSGRELSLEASYQFALDDDRTALAVGGFARLNPDHDPSASADLGIGVRFGLRL